MALGKVGVIGGGINGLCIAWALAERGWQVHLFERERCLGQTSRASTKLLHGGLRYLEQGHLALVAESVRERERWLRDVPQHTRWLPLLLPVYGDYTRPSWQWRLGLGLYDGLALGRLPGFARWLPPSTVRQQHPDLRPQGLQGAWLFWDGQMDEENLGQWVLQQAAAAGVRIQEQASVQQVTTAAGLDLTDGQHFQFDYLVNVAGPWAQQLLEQSQLSSDVCLTLVRGSHLLIPVPSGWVLPETGLFVEVPCSRRIAFLLPYQKQLLVGTTEEEQSQADPIAASAAEQQLLWQLVDHYLPDWSPVARHQGQFYSGLRPIVRLQSTAGNVSEASRDAVLYRHYRLITVFGGKWTTARSLAQRVVHTAPLNGQP